MTFLGWNELYVGGWDGMHMGLVFVQKGVGGLSFVNWNGRSIVAHTHKRAIMLYCSYPEIVFVRSHVHLWREGVARALTWDLRSC